MLRIIRHHLNRTQTLQNILLKAAYSKYMYHIKSAFESGLFERHKILNFKVVYSKDTILKVVYSKDTILIVVYSNDAILKVVYSRDTMLKVVYSKDTTSILKVVYSRDTLY